MKYLYIDKLAKSLTITGFKKKNLTWTKEDNIFCYVFNIQPSKYKNNNNQEDFTINIGIYSKIIQNLSWNKDTSSNISITDCCLNGRLIDFFNLSNNWFYINNESEIELIKLNLINILEQNIIPFFTNIKTYEDLYQIMLDYKDKAIQKELYQIYISCVESLLGKKDEAIKRLMNLQNTFWEDKALILVEKLKK
jgi:hypothetical protein